MRQILSSLLSPLYLLLILSLFVTGSFMMAKKTKAADAAPTNAPTLTDPANTVILTLAGGDVYIQLRPDLAPNHAARIKELVKSGFYDGQIFHRVIDGFMAQTGDPTGTGMGGSGKKLKAEFSQEPFVRGTVGMARAASPDSADSQFFICFAPASFLNGQYTVVGKVISGMEFVDKVPRGEPPENPAKILKMRMANQ
jgi:peptidylprolyl isomerase